MPKNNSQRRSQRLEWVRPASVKVKAQRVLATTRNVSRHGAFLVAASRIEKGAEIDLTLLLPPELAGEGQGWVRCRAKVVRVEDNGGRGGVGIAAEIQSFQKAVNSG